MADLLNCPFCGEGITQPRDGLNYRHPDNKCFIGGRVITLDEIAAWNTRNPAPEAVDVRTAAKVLMGLPYHVMSEAFDAMELREGDGVDTQFAAALRALAAGGE